MVPRGDGGGDEENGMYGCGAPVVAVAVVVSDSDGMLGAAKAAPVATVVG
jgi:hypothetical protein